MQVIELSLEERVKSGCSHLAIADYTDLNGTAGTGKTLTFFTYAARDVLGRLKMDLVTPFVGAAVTNLTVKVGYNGASVDDDDAFLPLTELAGVATEILAATATPAAPDASTVDETYSTAESTVVNSLRTVINNLRAALGLAAQEAGTVEAVFTSTGANLTALTAGRVKFFFDVVRLPDFRDINGL